MFGTKIRSLIDYHHSSSSPLRVALSRIIALSRIVLPRVLEYRSIGRLLHFDYLAWLRLFRSVHWESLRYRYNMLTTLVRLLSAINQIFNTKMYLEKEMLYCYGSFSDQYLLKRKPCGGNVLSSLLPVM